jgi:hypothetical protein
MDSHLAHSAGFYGRGQLGGDAGPDRQMALGRMDAPDADHVALALWRVEQAQLAELPPAIRLMQPLAD